MIEQLFYHLTEMAPGVGILAIFFVLLLCGIGLPLPEDIPLIAAGYLIFLKETSMLTAISVSIIGVLVGDSIIFYVGRHLGWKLFRSRIAMTITTPDRIKKVEAYYHKYGTKLVFFGRFVAGIRAPIFFVAGAAKISYAKFLLFDGLAAVISVPVWIYLGYYFGDKIEWLLSRIHRAKEISYPFMGLLVLSIILVVVFRSRKAKESVAHAEEEIQKEHFVAAEISNEKTGDEAKETTPTTTPSVKNGEYLV